MKSWSELIRWALRVSVRDRLSYGVALLLLPAAALLGRWRPRGADAVAHRGEEHSRAVAEERMGICHPELFYFVGSAAILRVKTWRPA